MNRNKNLRIDEIYTTNVIKLYKLFTDFGFRKDPKSMRLAKSILTKLSTWCTCEGRHGLDRFKSISNACIRVILGQSWPELSYKVPRSFRRAILLSRNSYMDSLFWISVFNSYRLVILKPEYEVSTITGGFDGSLFRFVKNFWTNLSPVCSVMRKTYHIKTPGSIRLKWNISGSAGPNGSPAYAKFNHDVHAILNSSLSIKIFCLYRSLPVINRGDTENSISDAIKWQFKNWSLMSSQNPVHSRLAFLSDKGGKTRVVAIVDILSQSILKPVHDHLFSILRKIPEDGTFDQDLQRARVMEWTKSEDLLSSIDLSACTDRFPAAFQAAVLLKCNVLTPWQAFWWLQVIARRPFIYNDKGRKRIRYRVGQPMGALSSWPAMAFCHHVLVQLSYKSTYPESEDIYSEYALLGDDLVIRDRRVAETYKDIISSLGMPWSPSKSFEAVGVAEFAKSLFRDGKNLKPFPLLLLSFRKNTLLTDAQALLKEISDRSFSIDISQFLRLYPKRFRSLITSAVLSPSSRRSCLGGPFMRLNSEKFNTFESIILDKRIRSFYGTEKVHESTSAFIANDPTKMEVRGNPFIQIAQDNSDNYPVRYGWKDGDNVSPFVVVGSGWIAWDPDCWPEGIPCLSDRKLIPGPSWKKDIDDVIQRQSFQEMEKLVPGWFWPWCNDHRLP